MAAIFKKVKELAGSIKLKVSSDGALRAGIGDKEAVVKPDRLAKDVGQFIQGAGDTITNAVAGPKLAEQQKLLDESKAEQERLSQVAAEQERNRLALEKQTAKNLKSLEVSTLLRESAGVLSSLNNILIECDNTIKIDLKKPAEIDFAQGLKLAVTSFTEKYTRAFRYHQELTGVILDGGLVKSTIEIPQLENHAGELTELLTTLKGYTREVEGLKQQITQFVAEVQAKQQRETTAALEDVKERAEQQRKEQEARLLLVQTAALGAQAAAKAAHKLAGTALSAAEAAETTADRANTRLNTVDATLIAHTSALEEGKRANERIKQELSEVGNAGDEAKEKADKIATAQEQQQVTLVSLKSRVVHITTAVDDLKSAADEAKEKADKIATAQEQQKATLASLKDKVIEATSAVDDLSNAVEQNHAAATHATRDLKGMVLERGIQLDELKQQLDDISAQRQATLGGSDGPAKALHLSPKLTVGSLNSAAGEGWTLVEDEEHPLNADGKAKLRRNSTNHAAV